MRRPSSMRRWVGLWAVTRSYTAVTKLIARSPKHKSSLGPHHFRVPRVVDQSPFGNQNGILEDLHQQDSGDETTNVSPNRDASRNVGTHRRQLRESGDDLPSEPPEERHPGGDGNDPHE